MKYRNTTEKYKNYYKELIFEMINNGEALFFVMSVENKPISISLSFLSKNILFYAIPVIDIDFFKFNIGHTSILKLFEWCIDNKFQIFDFSKGGGVYKSKWATNNYFYEHHIIYSHKISSILLANLLKNYYNFKQNLRNKNVNTKIQKLKFNKKIENDNTYYIANDFETDSSGFEEIENYKFENPKITSALNEFLYKNSINFNDVKIYTNQNNLLIKSENKSQGYTLIKKNKNE